MSRITVVRTAESLPPDFDAVRRFLLSCVNGFTREDRSAWGRLWARIKRMTPGEMCVFDVVSPRSGPFHRRHMKIEQAVFDNQERFESFKQFRVWLKVGAGWVDWCAGPKGGVVPIPKSVSYAEADEDEFRQFHGQVMGFLRGPHAAAYLWPHAGDAAAAMNAVLMEFDE